MSGYGIIVSEHAYWRAAERFPGFDTVLIEEEVRAAMKAGRISVSRAELGLHPSDRHDGVTLYCWTPDGERVYALRHTRVNRDLFVATVLRRI